MHMYVPVPDTARGKASRLGADASPQPATLGQDLGPQDLHAVPVLMQPCSSLPFSTYKRCIDSVVARPGLQGLRCIADCNNGVLALL